MQKTSLLVMKLISTSSKRTKKGINDKAKFINDETNDEIGKIRVGTFIDFNTPALDTTDVSI